jgi:hypothetical protein
MQVTKQDLRLTRKKQEEKKNENKRKNKNTLESGK